VPTPVPENTVRVNLVWTLPSTEIAVNTLHFQHLHQSGNTLDWAGDMTQRYADLVLDGIKSVWSNMSALWPAGVKIQRADAYHLGADGATIDKKTSLATGARVMAGSSASEMLPFHDSCAVSLYGYNPSSYDPQGSRKRGRIYMPPMAVTTMSSGYSNAKDTLLAQWTAAFSYMQNRPMDSGTTLRERAQLVINSKKFVLNSPVTHVRVDNQVDAIRRRDSALTPIVSSAALTPQA